MEEIEMNLTEMTNDQIKGMVMLIEQITKSNLANNIDQPISPEMIAVMAEAEKRGLKTVGGLDMLIYQAERAIEIWTGKTPDTKLMKIAALEVL